VSRHVANIWECWREKKDVTRACPQAHLSKQVVRNSKKRAKVKAASNSLFVYPKETVHPRRKSHPAAKDEMIDVLQIIRKRSQSASSISSSISSTTTANSAESEIVLLKNREQRAPLVVREESHDNMFSADFGAGMEDTFGMDDGRGEQMTESEIVLLKNSELETKVKTMADDLAECHLQMENLCCMLEEAANDKQVIADLELEIRDLKDSSTVPDVQHLVTEGPELEARIVAAREERTRSDQLLKEQREAYDNKVSTQYNLNIM
jgi:hypothetical protein